MLACKELIFISGEFRYESHNLLSSENSKKNDEQWLSQVSGMGEWNGGGV